MSPKPDNSHNDKNLIQIFHKSYNTHTNPDDNSTPLNNNTPLIVSVPMNFTILTNEDTTS